VCRVTRLPLHPGAGAAHENCDVRDIRVKVTDGASVLNRAACKPSNKGDSLGLELQIRTHEKGQNGPKIVGSDGVCDARAVSEPGRKKKIRTLDIQSHCHDESYHAIF
jgi:hypothetical protein